MPETPTKTVDLRKLIEANSVEKFNSLQSYVNKYSIPGTKKANWAAFQQALKSQGQLAGHTESINASNIGDGESLEAIPKQLVLVITAVLMVVTRLQKTQYEAIEKPKAGQIENLNSLKKRLEKLIIVNTQFNNKVNLVTRASEQPVTSATQNSSIGGGLSKIRVNRRK
ncbi:MAG: hypothetical protein H7230_01885 [Candidatus Parcubacteria bacterium]|nr:hypothetical protein [Candidatus Paceibacterota bacterium]